MIDSNLFIPFETHIAHLVDQKDLFPKVQLGHSLQDRCAQVLFEQVAFDNFNQSEEDAQRIILNKARNFTEWLTLKKNLSPNIVQDNAKKKLETLSQPYSLRDWLRWTPEEKLLCLLFNRLLQGTTSEQNKTLILKGREILPYTEATKKQFNEKLGKTISVIAKIIKSPWFYVPFVAVPIGLIAFSTVIINVAYVAALIFKIAESLFISAVDWIYPKLPARVHDIISISKHAGNNMTVFYLRHELVCKVSLIFTMSLCGFHIRNTNNLLGILLPLVPPLERALNRCGEICGQITLWCARQTANWTARKGEELEMSTQAKRRSAFIAELAHTRQLWVYKAKIPKANVLRRLFGNVSSDPFDRKREFTHMPLPPVILTPFDESI